MRHNKFMQKTNKNIKEIINKLNNTNVKQRPNKLRGLQWRK